MQYTDLMLDCETTSLKHNNGGAIIQIAAVRFNLAEQTIDHNMFNACLLIPANRGWDLDTYQWWSKRPEVLQRIYSQMRDPRIVMKEFEDWLAFSQPRFWSKPSHFDYSYIEAYTEQFLDRKSLFHFRDAENMNSWIRGRYFPNPVPNLYEACPMKGGQAHDAIFDVLNQIQQLFYVVKDTTRPVEKEIVYLPAEDDIPY